MCGKDRIDSHLTGGLIGKSKSEMPSSPAISSTSSDKPDKYAEPSRRLPQYALSVAECLTLSEQGILLQLSFPLVTNSRKYTFLLFATEQHS